MDLGDQTLTYNLIFLICYISIVPLFEAKFRLNILTSNLFIYLFIFFFRYLFIFFFKYLTIEPPPHHPRDQIILLHWAIIAQREKLLDLIALGKYEVSYTKSQCCKFGFFFANMRSFVKIEPSLNGEITMSFTDVSKLCPSREF